MTNDPFGATGTATMDDPFATPSGGGNFPRPVDLLGKTLLLEPIKYTIQNGQFGEQTRWEADTTVFDADGSTSSYNRMYWSQKPIAEELRAAQKRGKPVLGTLHIVPVGASKKRFNSEAELLADEDIKRWIARGGTGNPPTSIAWVLQRPTDAERAVAVSYWKVREDEKRKAQEAENPF